MEQYHRLDHLLCQGVFGAVYKGYKKDSNDEIVDKSVVKRSK